MADHPKFCDEYVRERGSYVNLPTAFRPAYQSLLDLTKRVLSRPKAVSKGAANAASRGKPAPFDTRFTLFRATQDAGLNFRSDVGAVEKASGVEIPRPRSVV